MPAQEPRGWPETPAQQRRATSKSESTNVAEAHVQVQCAKLEMQEQEHIQQYGSSTINQQTLYTYIRAWCLTRAARTDPWPTSTITC
jgi:hypothetical protein